MPIDLGPSFWRGDPSYDQSDNPDDIDRARAAATEAAEDSSIAVHEIAPDDAQGGDGYGD
jgi:hypothetical protein